MSGLQGLVIKLKKIFIHPTVGEFAVELIAASFISFIKYGKETKYFINKQR